MSTLADLRKNLEDPKKLTSANGYESVSSAATKRCPHLTKTEIAALVEIYQQGDLSVRDLAAQFGIHRETVAHHLDRAGITKRRKMLDPQQIAEAIRLHKAGWSLARIAKHLGVYPTSSNYRLKQAGVALRPRTGR